MFCNILLAVLFVVCQLLVEKKSAEKNNDIIHLIKHFDLTRMKFTYTTDRRGSFRKRVSSPQPKCVSSGQYTMYDSIYHFVRIQ